jgi:CheY-like chemotaxis protein
MPEPSPAGAGILRRLSVRTKALVIANEFTHRQMEPRDLREVLAALALEADEQHKVARAVEEELRAARYPVGEILQLMGALLPGEAAPPPPHDPNVVVTRKVRSPSLMPFERFEFDPTGEPEATPEAAPAEAGEPEGAPPAAAPASFKFTRGGEEAGFSASGLRDLVKKGPEAGEGRQFVLVADDDARSRMMYRASLEEAGFAVAEAKDGVEAWTRIRSGAVRCAVMDMKMPGYHGLEVLSRMVDSGLTLPVVIVSAYDQLANEFVVATYPKLKFLTKPAPPDRVAEAVEALLRPGRRPEGG